MEELASRKDIVAQVIRKDLSDLASGAPGVHQRRAAALLEDPRSVSSAISAVWKSLSGPGVPPARAKDIPSIRAKLLQLHPGSKKNFFFSLIFIQIKKKFRAQGGHI